MFVRIAAATVATIAGAGLALVPSTAHANPQSCDGQVIRGTLGPDTLDGTDCDDFLFGLWGRDTLRGHYGSDWLSGGRGNDTILDYQDNNWFGSFDVLKGGRGFDKCVGDPGDQFINCEVVILR